MKFTDLNYKDVVFKDCPVHTELRYAGEVCPVCEASLKIQVLCGKIAELQLELEEKENPF